MLFSILKEIKFKGRLEIIDFKGNKHSFGEGEDFSKIRFTNKSIERKLFRNPSLYLGEGYMNGEIIIEKGNLDDFIKIITSLLIMILCLKILFLNFMKIFLVFFKSFQQINKLVTVQKIM